MLVIKRNNIVVRCPRRITIKPWKSSSYLTKMAAFFFYVHARNGSRPKFLFLTNLIKCV